jgi:DNA-binding ferritin-like protein
MLELAVTLQTLKLYAHAAHHICARVVFNQDHDTLSDIYSKADSDYDDVIERYIGIYGDESLDEAKIISSAAQKMANLPLKQAKENKELLKTCLDLHKDICSKIEVLCKNGKTSQGTIQLLGDIANASEVTQYKLKQRLK